MVLNAPGGAQVTGGIGFDALESRTMRVDLRTHRRPVGLTAVPLAAAVDARLQADVDAVARTARGPLGVRAEAYLQGTPLGTVEVRGGVEGRTVRAQRLHADVLGGTADGGAVVPLDDWTKIRAQLQLAGLDLSKLGQYAGAAGDVRGIVTGSIGVSEGRPEHGEPPLGPLRIEADLRVTEGFQRGMHFGDVKASGYAGPDRVVLDVFDVQIAGGEAHVWSRLSWHGTEPFLHVDTDFKNLQVRELARAVDADYKDTPGLITGRLTLGRACRGLPA
jgi:hypothetical protein